MAVSGKRAAQVMDASLRQRCFYALRSGEHIGWTSRIVPAWATVVIALGASAIGALAGIFGAYISLRIARLSLDHQASEAWRTRRLEAAEDFSASWTADKWCRPDPWADRCARRPGKRGRDGEREARRGGAKLMRVGLLFGADSPAREAGRQALSQLNQATGVLETFIRSAHAADEADAERKAAIRKCNEHMSRSQAAHKEFIGVAHTELLSPADSSRGGGPVGGDLRAEG